LLCIFSKASFRHLYYGCNKLSSSTLARRLVDWVTNNTLVVVIVDDDQYVCMCGSDQPYASHNSVWQRVQAIYGSSPGAAMSPSGSTPQLREKVGSLRTSTSGTPLASRTTNKSSST